MCAKLIVNNISLMCRSRAALESPLSLGILLKTATYLAR